MDYREVYQSWCEDPYFDEATREELLAIKDDDNEIREYNEMLFTAAMNEPYEGGGFRFGADASADDGMLDFCTGDSLSRYDFFRIFPYAYSGSHVKFSGVHMRKAKKAEIFSEHPLWIHTDGEIEWLSDHVTMELIPEKLKMML